MGDDYQAHLGIKSMQLGDLHIAAFAHSVLSIWNVPSSPAILYSPFHALLNILGSLFGEVFCVSCQGRAYIAVTFFSS